MAADKLMPVEMHLMSEEVRMSAAEKLMHTGRQFKLEVVHLRTAETLVPEEMHPSPKKSSWRLPLRCCYLQKCT